MILKIEINPEMEESLKRLMSECGVDNTKELFNTSLTLLQWAVAEEKSGRTISSFDLDKKYVEKLRMPILDKIRENLDKKETKVEKGSHLKVVK